MTSATLKEKKPKRVSPILRLREMPAVFSIRDLGLHFGWSQEQTWVYANRWVAQGLVKLVAARSGLYFNLVKDTNFQAHIQEAALRLYPQGIHVGSGILQREGWTTQGNEVFEVAVKAGTRIYKSDFILASKRHASWFAVVSKERAYHTHHVMRELLPSWAFADLVVLDLPGRPDPDDVYLSGALGAGKTVEAVRFALTQIAEAVGTNSLVALELAQRYALAGK